MLNKIESFDEFNELFYKMVELDDDSLFVELGIGDYRSEDLYDEYVVKFEDENDEVKSISDYIDFLSESMF